MTSGRCGVLAKALLAVYVLAAALLPLGHHDVLCHLKSPSHCTTCVASSTGETMACAPSFEDGMLPDAGRAIVAASLVPARDLVRLSSGRSPPSLG